MGDDWNYIRLNDFVHINPSERIMKGQIAKKVPMDSIGHWMRNIISFQSTKYNGGAKFKNGDTLIARITPCLENGKTAYVDILVDNEIAFGSTEYIVLREKKGVSDKKFVYYLSISPMLRHIAIQSMTGSTGRQRVQTDVLAKTKFKLPALPVQKSIAHILGTLDDKIELNRQMNQTLEQMAQALYKSWFVDFDPVIDNVIASGNEIPEPFQKRAEARSGLGDKWKPLPKDIQKLFPREFEYFGEFEKWVPKGWGVKPLEDCLEINPSLKLSKGTPAKHVEMKALPKEGYIINDYINKKYTGGGAKFQQGDVLLARITPCLENGKTGIIDFLNEQEVAFGSTEFIVLRGKGEIKTPLVACLARETSVRNHCIQSMVGSSGRQRVQIAAFNNYYLALPSAEILKGFDRIVNPFFTKMTLLSKEIKSLKKIRDNLLPMLISGRITVAKN